MHSKYFAKTLAQNSLREKKKKKKQKICQTHSTTCISKNIYAFQQKYKTSSITVSLTVRQEATFHKCPLSPHLHFRLRRMLIYNLES